MVSDQTWIHLDVFVLAEITDRISNAQTHAGVVFLPSLPFEGLSGVPLTLARLQSALHGRVAHLLLVSRHQPAAAHLRHQALDEGADGQRVRVVRPAEVIGQALLLQAPLRPLHRRGPQQLRAHCRLPAAGPPHQQHPPGATRLSRSRRQRAGVGQAPAGRQRGLLAGRAAGSTEAAGFLLEAVLDLVEDPLPAVKALPLQQTGLSHFEVELLVLLFIGVPSHRPSRAQLREEKSQGPFPRMKCQ